MGFWSEAWKKEILPWEIDRGCGLMSIPVFVFWGDREIENVGQIPVTHLPHWLLLCVCDGRFSISWKFTLVCIPKEPECSPQMKEHVLFPLFLPFWFYCCFCLCFGSTGVPVLFHVPLLCPVLSGHNKSIPASYCGPSGRARFGAIGKRILHVHYFKL